MTNLKFLILESNNLETIDYGTFRDMNNLKVLDLSKNRLTKIAKYGITNSTYLKSLFKN